MTTQQNTTEQNKAIVTRFNKEFIEGGNLDTFNEIIDPGFVNQSAPAGMPKGPEGVLIFFNNFIKSAFPDLTVEIHEQIAEGNKVTTRKSFHATHKGGFLGVPATGKRVKMEAIDIIYLRDGKFTEHWGLLDVQGILAQITG
jgi:steroid delta-isomerase-like uncharacterized protein